MCQWAGRAEKPISYGAEGHHACACALQETARGLVSTFVVSVGAGAIAETDVVVVGNATLNQSGRTDILLMADASVS